MFAVEFNLDFHSTAAHALAPFKKGGSLARAARAAAILRDGYFDSYVSEARKKRDLGGGGRKK